MNLRARLHSSGVRPMLGVFLGLPVPTLVETIGRAGCDYVILDGEHGTFAPAQLEECLRAATAVRLPAIVRVPDAHPVAIQVALDAGAEGVQVPSVESAEQARRVVRATRFPPRGERGFGSTTRAAEYGFVSRARVLQTAADSTVVVVQVESRRGIEALSEIVDVDGIDLVFFGTSDLSLDLGLDSPSDERLIPVLGEAIAIAARRGTPCAVHAVEPKLVRPMQRLGVGCFTTAYQTIVAQALRSAVDEYGRELAEGANR